MPIEREFKYVLHSPDDLWTLLSTDTSGIVTGRTEIIQGYLGRGGRIRRRTWSLRRGFPSNSIENIFTYKFDLSKQPGCLEIETPMSNEDFDLAWSESDHLIRKTRFILPNEDRLGVWEIDFFQDDAGIYLAMAEFEVPSESGPPSQLHPLVESYLLFDAGEDDSRFKNRKLCERHKVEKLLKEISQ